MINTVPALPHLLIVLFVWSIVIARFIYLPRSLDNSRLTAALAFGGAALVLKDPIVGPVVAHLLGSVNLRVLVHVMVMLSVTALSGLHNAWRINPGRRRMTARYGLVLGFGVVMFLLASPAREADITVESLADWRSVMYFALFAFPVSAGLFSVSAAYFTSLLQRGRRCGNGTVLGVIIVLVLMFIDAATMLLAAGMKALGSGAGVVSAKESTNTWVFAVLLAAAAAVCARALITHARGRRVDGVATLWSVVTTEMPEVILTSGSALSSRQSRLRMATEIYDGLRALGATEAPSSEHSVSSSEVARRVLGCLTPAAQSPREEFLVPRCDTADEWLVFVDSVGQELALILPQNLVEQTPRG
ncbi:hypothetical protein [Hoyosella subflava]|uniref:Uncharacterized protein n=1 Tax=Hoyosella subflava (strain DSM 45089 / JCM 17490 / NBRC 109087 / DQS3-9A1) TaxID=443218 RepID=F6ESH1_HOYSD|nr:hypothetical protein [Hoyosella subflava]AEF43092.1 hypothetical protein AS9A_P20048 [Hoyosella subflava DQS3-9A1]